MPLILTLILLLITSCTPQKPKIVKMEASQIIESCEERKLCPELEDSFSKCKYDEKEEECRRFIDTFRKLSGTTTCKRSFDTRPVPSVWVCDEGKSYPGTFTNAASFLDELIVKYGFALNFYSSDEFRSNLDGETAEAYRAKSEAISLFSKGTNKREFTSDMVKRIDQLHLAIKEDGVFLDKNDWIVLMTFLSIKEAEVISPLLLPNYTKIVEIINELNDAYLMQMYLNFIINTEGSADENRSNGLAVLYHNRSEMFLSILASFDSQKQKILIKNTAFGLSNTVLLDIKKSEYINTTPTDKSVYTKEFKHHKLAQAIVDECMNID
jgi:hypothetical protein